ncbi:MAG: hypothetical protein ABI376_06150 [Caulobacteraceae bacterium]
MEPLLLDLPDWIETGRLVIRPPRAGDGQSLFEAVAESLTELRKWPASLGWAMAEPSRLYARVRLSGAG